MSVHDPRHQSHAKHFCGGSVRAAASRRGSRRTQNKILAPGAHVHAIQGGLRSSQEGWGKTVEEVHTNNRTYRFPAATLATTGRPLFTVACSRVHGICSRTASAVPSVQAGLRGPTASQQSHLSSNRTALRNDYVPVSTPEEGSPVRRDGGSSNVLRRGRLGDRRQLPHGLFSDQPQADGQRV